MNSSKGINLFAALGIALAVIVVIVVVLVLVLGNSGNTPAAAGGGAGGAELGEPALKLNSLDEFQKFAKDEGYEHYVGEDLSGGSMIGVTILGEQAIVTYYFNEQKIANGLEAFYYFNTDVMEEGERQLTELKPEELTMKCRDAAERFCMMFGCNEVPDLYISNYDGSFTKVESDGDFQSILDATGELRLSARDQEGYFWQLSVSGVDGVISANIQKYFDREATKDYVANISLYEEE